MKRLLILILAVIFFTSCSRVSLKNRENNTSNKTEPNEVKYTVADYYPFVENVRMQYEGIGNEYSEKDVFVDYLKDNRIQLRVINPGTILGQVIENKDGELRLIVSAGEFYSRDDLTSFVNSQPEVLLKEPLEKGTAWTLANGSKRYISNTNVDVTVPYGHYKALEVTTESGDSKVFDYYVLHLGLVKTVFKSNDVSVETNLANVEKKVSVQQTIKFYYPDLGNNRTVFIKERLSFNTNDDLKKTFEKYFKLSPGKGIPKVMSNNTVINKLYLNRAGNNVYVDFSKEFINEMNAGTSLEELITQSVTNTFGDYYNVDKVYITIDGKPYSSGHIMTKENEPFYVNYKNVKEFK